MIDKALESIAQQVMTICVCSDDWELQSCSISLHDDEPWKLFVLIDLTSGHTLYATCEDDQPFTLGRREELEFMFGLEVSLLRNIHQYMKNNPIWERSKFLS